MPTKKERITELERQVEELTSKVSGLEQKLSGYWLVDKNSPYLFTYPQYRHCQWCGKSVDDTRWHYCPNYPNQLVNPIPWLTVTYGSTKIDTSSSQAVVLGNSIVSNGVTYGYESPKSDVKEGE